MSYDIQPGHIILAMGQPIFALNYPLYVEHLTRELQLPIWNLWCDSTGNRTWASQTRSECSTTMLPCWSTISTSNIQSLTLFRIILILSSSVNSLIMLQYFWIIFFSKWRLRCYFFIRNNKNMKYVIFIHQRADYVRTFFERNGKNGG